MGNKIGDRVVLTNEGGLKQDCVVLCLAWRYMEPISKRNKKFLENDGEFLVIDLSSASMKEYRL